MWCCRKLTSLRLHPASIAYIYTSIYSKTYKLVGDTTSKYGIFYEIGKLEAEYKAVYVFDRLYDI